MICFCYFCSKICLLIWVWSIQFLEVLPIFFRTTGLQLNLLILIEFSNIFHWEAANNKKKDWVLSWSEVWAKLGPMLWKKEKKLPLSISFSHILHGEYILKQEVVVVQTPEWKFKANIAINATSGGR